MLLLTLNLVRNGETNGSIKHLLWFTERKTINCTCIHWFLSSTQDHIVHNQHLRPLEWTLSLPPTLHEASDLICWGEPTCEEHFPTAFKERLVKSHHAILIRKPTCKYVAATCTSQSNFDLPCIWKIVPIFIFFYCTFFSSKTPRVAEASFPYKIITATSQQLQS